MNKLFDLEAELQKIRRLQKTKKYKSLAKKISKIPCTGPSVAEVFAMMNGEYVGPSVTDVIDKRNESYPHLIYSGPADGVEYEIKFNPLRSRRQVKRKRRRNYYTEKPMSKILVQNGYLNRKWPLRGVVLAYIFVRK